jgi:hypothetical protein
MTISTAGTALLPVPTVPPHHRDHYPGGPVAFSAGHHFALATGADPAPLAETATAPLSVIVQITKRCDFNCGFCSETLQMADPSLEQLDTIRANLAGGAAGVLVGWGAAAAPGPARDRGHVSRLHCRAADERDQGPGHGAPSGGEGGVRQRRFRRATRHVLTGPRDYDKAMAGVRAFIEAGLPLSLSAVELRSTLLALPYLCQIADVLDAGKLKLILPLRKGNALGLPEREFITVEEARDAFERLVELRATHDWRPAVRMTPWTQATEGHMIVVEPDGETHAWPVYDQPDLFLRLGNLLEQPIAAIWGRYRYKASHYAKYLGASIYTTARSSP